MPAINLSLFSAFDTALTIDAPLKKIEHSQSYFTHPLAPLETALQGIFSQNTEENTIIKTRKILRERAKTLTDEQIHCINTEFQFLITAWLDEFEKDIFNGLTLQEVLNEK